MRRDVVDHANGVSKADELEVGAQKFIGVSVSNHTTIAFGKPLSMSRLHLSLVFALHPHFCFVVPHLFEHGGRPVLFVQHGVVQLHFQLQIFVGHFALIWLLLQDHVINELDLVVSLRRFLFIR